jgi:hypothetical protein
MSKTANRNWHIYFLMSFTNIGNKIYLLTSRLMDSCCKIIYKMCFYTFCCKYVPISAFFSKYTLYMLLVELRVIQEYAT